MTQNRNREMKAGAAEKIQAHYRNSEEILRRRTLRAMYERIAAGNSLSEVEEEASKKWF